MSTLHLKPLQAIAFHTERQVPCNPKPGFRGLGAWGLGGFGGVGVLGFGGFGGFGGLGVWGFRVHSPKPQTFTGEAWILNLIFTAALALFRPTFSCRFFG